MMIRARQKEIEEIKELASCTGAIDYSKDRVISSITAGAGFENRICAAVDMEREIEKEIKELREKRTAVKNAIDELTDIDIRTTLDMYYITGSTIKGIAEATGVSERKVKERIDKGIAMINRS